MIKSFRCRDTEYLFHDLAGGRFRAIERVARRKLEMLAAAERLEDLRVPPGNRDGQFSIRVNDQWRVCFTWRGKDAFDVEIVDYH
jgi:toxin HigB-1